VQFLTVSIVPAFSNAANPGGGSDGVAIDLDDTRAVPPTPDGKDGKQPGQSENTEGTAQVPAVRRELDSYFAEQLPGSSVTAFGPIRVDDTEDQPEQGYMAASLAMLAVILSGGWGESKRKPPARERLTP
jgi:hypothetical protein